MSVKSSVLWSLVIVGTLAVAGCNKPNSPPAGGKGATPAPPAGPAANTTDSK